MKELKEHIEGLAWVVLDVFVIGFAGAAGVYLCALLFDAVG